MLRYTKEEKQTHRDDRQESVSGRFDMFLAYGPSLHPIALDLETGWGSGMSFKQLPY